MSDAPSHIIEKISVNINTNTLEQAHRIEKDIKTFINQKVIPEIELFFAQFDQPILHIRMDKISLNFDESVLSNPFWKTELYKQLQRNFKQTITTLEKITRNKSEIGSFSEKLILKNIEIRNNQESDLLALNYFLVTGSMPWWMHANPQRIQGLLSTEQILRFLDQKDDIHLLKNLLKKQPTARKRWVLQFNDSLQLAIYWKLIAPIYAPTSSTKNIVEYIISSPIFQAISRQDRHEIWFALITLGVTPDTFHSLLRKKEFIQHVVLRFIRGKTYRTMAILNHLIDSLIKQSNQSHTNLNLPPILSLALLLVVEIPQKSAQTIKTISTKTSSPNFEIIETLNSKFKWQTSQLNHTIIDNVKVAQLEEHSKEEQFDSKNTLYDSFLFFCSLYLNGSKLCLKHHYYWYFMSESSNHIIEKISIEIDVGSVEQARKIENDIQAFIKEKIIPEIELFFEAIDRPDLHLQLDQISLNFDKEILTNPFWKTDLKIQLQREFQEPIAALGNSGETSPETDLFARKDIEIRNVEKSDLQALSHFLVSGNAPWWMNTATQGMKQLLKEKNILDLIERTDVVNLVERLFKEQPTTRKRWVLQFSDTVQLAIFWKLLRKVYVPPSSTKNVLKKIIESPMFNAISKQDRHEIWFALHTLASNPSKFQSTSKKIELIQHIVLRFSRGKTMKTTVILNKLISSIVEKSDLPVAHGELPPILYFATLLVVETSELKHQNAKTNLDKSLRPEFEVIENNDFTFEWVLPTIKSSNEASNSTKNQTSIKLQEGELGVSKESESIKNKKSKLKPDKASETINEQGENQNSQEFLETNEFEEILKQDWNHNNQPKDIGKGIYVENAGILLMHPFLSPLFSNLGYLNDKKQFLNPMKAVQILHFMATSELECFEHELQFAKFFCGLSGGEVMDKSMVISDKEKEEVESVLSSALQHWTSLKSSSIPLLQHEFLKRPGKLYTDGNMKRIVMEQKTVDILMNGLPWGIGMIRLPWMDELLYVDWAN